MHFHRDVTRRLAVIMAALVLPGGLVALFGAWIFKVISRTDRGRRALSFARKRVRSVRPLPVGADPVPRAA